MSTCATGVTEEMVKTEEWPTFRSSQENRAQKQRDADTFIYFCLEIFAKLDFFLKQ